MKKHRKKRTLRLWKLMPIVMIGYIGWYFTSTIRGIISWIIGYFMFMTLWKIRKKWRTSMKLRRAGIKEVDQMSGEEFERFLGELFKRRGYKVSYTATSGDYGADLLLKDGKELIVIQAKRYKGSVGIKAVQEVLGAIRMYEATEAWVITNSYFTKQAKTLAEANDIYLIERNDLIELILDK